MPHTGSEPLTTRLSTGSAVASDKSWSRLASLDVLQGPGPFSVCAEGVDLVVLPNVGGDFRAFEGRCPHQGALLGEGELTSDSLVCRNHRWRFDPRTGQRRGGPECLRPCEVKVQDGVLYGDLSPFRASQRAPHADGPKTERVTRRVADLPGPRPWPLVGNALEIEPSSFHETLEGWAREFGPVFRVKFGSRDVLGIADPEWIAEVLRERPSRYRRLAKLEPIFHELGTPGVFSSEGADWRPLRRLTMKALSPHLFRGFYSALKTVAERLHRRWQQRAERQDVFDLNEDMKCFSVDVTSLLAFGHDANTLEQDADGLQAKLEQVFPGLNRRIAALLPYWRFVKLPADRRLERVVAELGEWMSELIAQARMRLAADRSRAENPTHFVEAMVSARDDSGEPFPDTLIVGNSLQILLAGEDTTANTLSWAVHELCDVPEVVHALRLELDERLGAQVVPESFECAQSLAYALAVAQETMRLRPVAPVMFMEPNEDVVLGDVEIPKGTGLWLALRPPAVDPQHFSEPRRFHPERWLDSSSNVGAHHASASLPFGSGPRICPGRSLALLEMRVALATLYKNFDVERVGMRQDVRETFAFTLSPSSVQVRLRPRSS